MCCPRVIVNVNITWVPPGQIGSIFFSNTYWQAGSPSTFFYCTFLYKGGRITIKYKAYTTLKKNKKQKQQKQKHADVSGQR